MLLTEDLSSWVGSELNASAFQIELPEKQPNRAISIADTGGLQLRVGGALDAPTFQFLIRDLAPQDARGLAFGLDRLIVDRIARQTIGGVFVTDAGRVGGRPQALGQDDRNRWIYSSNYWIESERT